MLRQLEKLKDKLMKLTRKIDRKLSNPKEALANL